MKRQDSSGIVRGSGILMPISSLPGRYGIGALGKEAVSFSDFAKECGFVYWQVLPAGPTSYGDSPYQSFSAFAGNPYFVDIDELVSEGLLTEKEAKEHVSLAPENDIDYEWLYNTRFVLLKKAYKKSKHKESSAYKSFLKKAKYWLDDYALFMALKEKFKGVSWQEWDEDIRFRKSAALKKYTKELADEVDFYKFIQFKFREQWDALKEHAHKNGQYLIGDIPLYVAIDSSDVWVHSNLFELDDKLLSINIAGVPPDAFSDTGQRWGNPIYDWKAMEAEDFKWWRERMKANAELYDIIRIDHFIGVVNYWSIPATCPTAVEGKWVKGPAKKLTDAIIESIGDSKIIAEDLGVVTAPVRKLMEGSNFPGMKVLEFGIDCNPDNPNLPQNYKTSNMVAYIGTHDNEPIVGFLKGKPKKELKEILDFFDKKNIPALVDELIKMLYTSIANIIVFQLQDILRLDNSARMNSPATLGINWRWRVTREQISSIDAESYKNMTIKANRVPKGFYKEEASDEKKAAVAKKETSVKKVAVTKKEAAVKKVAVAKKEAAVKKVAVAKKEAGAKKVTGKKKMTKK